MKLLVVDYAGHPFQYDLSAEFGARGHSVVHSYSASTVTPRAGFRPVDNVSLRPVDIGRTFERYRPLRRLRDEIEYGIRTAALAHRFEPDRVLASNVPVFSLAILRAWCAVTRTPIVLWLQDFQAGLAGMVRGHSGRLARVLAAVERFVIRRFARIIAISDEFAEQLSSQGVERERVTVIENWAPLAELPERPRNNRWSAEHGLDEAFVFLYSGTLGMKHSPQHLKALVDGFSGQDGVEIVVVAEGAGADWLRRQPPPRPRIIPLQPFEALPDVLASADVLITLLDADAGGFSVPSKALTYMCAGRCLLGAIPHQNAAARMIIASRAGVVVEPQDTEAFVAAARNLVADRALVGSMAKQARSHADASFDREVIADRFAAVLSMPAPTVKEPKRA